MNKDNKENKNSLIILHKQRAGKFKKILRPKNINIKKSFIKAKTNIMSINLNFPEVNDKSIENSKLSQHENRERNSPLLLPSIADTSLKNKKMLNSSTNNIFHNNIGVSPNKNPVIKLRKIRIKKSNDNKKNFIPSKYNQSLINLYHENLRLKQRMEIYKLQKAENMGDFSYKKYNYNLVKLSSIDLSLDSIKTFRKNINVIEDKMYGRIVKRKNRWLLLSDKIEDATSEKLKIKLKSLSERKDKKVVKNNDISK